MKVVFTEAALDDLKEILAFLAKNYPGVAPAVEARISITIARIGTWPESSRRVETGEDIRVAPIVRYPYKVFYRITAQAVEILHIHHAARQDPWEQERS